MTAGPSSVLDASALLAFLRNEPGAAIVEQALQAGAAICAVNWAEVLTKLADLGEDPVVIRQRLSDQGLLGGDLVVIPAGEELAVEIALLRPATRISGLSLADRACLSLARLMSLPVLTTEHTWASLKTGVEVRQIRTRKRHVK